MFAADFDMRALYDAIDARRRERGMTWTVVAREVNRYRTVLRPIASSTIMSLQRKPAGEGDGDGILQMLLWLSRTPESFVPDLSDSDAERFRLPTLTTGQILRWDTRAIFSALQTRRQARGLTWADVAREIRGFTPVMLTRMSAGGRTGFPHVMRLVRWLDQPAVAFTRIARW
jgi:hypothetical protein